MEDLMPNGGHPLNPAHAALLKPHGAWLRQFLKNQPLLVGAAWFLLLQATGSAYRISGHTLDPLQWRWISSGAGAAAYLVSRSHILVLAIRLVGLRFCSKLKLIERAGYTQLKDAVQTAFIERVSVAKKL